MKGAPWASCNALPLNKNQKLRAISVLSQANRENKHNAAGISTGDMGSTRELTKPSTPLHLCGELVNRLNSPLKTQLFQCEVRWVCVTALFTNSWQYLRKVLFHVTVAKTQYFGMKETVQWLSHSETWAAGMPAAFVPSCAGTTEEATASVHDFQQSCMHKHKPL